MEIRLPPCSDYPRLTTTTTSTYIADKDPPWSNFNIDDFLNSQRNSNFSKLQTNEKSYFLTSNQFQEKYSTKPAYNVPRRYIKLPDNPGIDPVEFSTYTSDYCNDLHNPAEIENPFHLKDSQTSDQFLLLKPQRRGKARSTLFHSVHKESEPVWEFQTDDRRELQTTFQADYTDKGKESQRVPAEVPPYGGSTGWSPSEIHPKFYSSQDIEAVLKRRSRDPVKHIHNPKIKEEMITTHRHDFTRPGFNPGKNPYFLDESFVAGQPTPRHGHLIKYSSGSLVAILDNQNAKFQNRNADWRRKHTIFLPHKDQLKRSGIQDFTDAPR